jgi:hypothetical protein
MLPLRFLATAALGLAVLVSCETTPPPEKAVSPGQAEAMAAAAHMSSVLTLSVSRVRDDVHYNLLDEPVTRHELGSKLRELAEFDNAIRIKIEPEADISDDLLEEVAQLISEAGLRVWTVDELHEEDEK